MAAMGGGRSEAGSGFFDRLEGGALARAPQPRGLYGLAAETLAALEALRLDAERPLLVLDADEVLLVFARRFQRFVETLGYQLDLSAYRLHGGVTRLSNGAIADRGEVSELIAAFFAAETRRQEAVGGAAEAVAALAEAADVVVLSNVPFSQAAARAERLAELGVDRPLVPNSGAKGRALRWLWDRTRSAVVFVDDTERQLASAAAAAPGVRRVRFIADDGLRGVAEPSQAAEAEFSAWEDGVSVLRGLLKAEPAS